MAMAIEELQGLGTHELIDVYECALFEKDEETAEAARGHLYSKWAGKIHSLIHEPLTKCISQHSGVLEDLLIIVHSAAGGCDHSLGAWIRARDKVDAMFAANTGRRIR